MAVRKRKIKRLKSTAVALFFFLISFATYLVTSIYLRSYNIDLVQQTANCQQEIVQIRNQNAALALEIQQLSAYDRVMSIASGANLALNQDNISTIGE
ncbi:MAG: hypothetical protein VB009_05395 [Erysipelotrichaceae bacterium]|nr:hypothetical protein [Erysipelotrichaceae bacterium]